MIHLVTFVIFSCIQTFSETQSANRVQQTTWKHKKYFILQNVLKNNEIWKLAYTNEDKCISC